MKQLAGGTDMRLAILMAVGSPWSKEVALRFCDLGHEVHIINVIRSSKQIGYLDNHSFLRQSTIKTLGERAHIHEIFPPVDSNLRYFLSGFALKSLCRKHGIEIVLSLYGGGFATMAYVSGFRDRK